MSRAAMVVVLACGVMALGCDDGGGGDDAGPGIVIMDSGPGGGGTDAGPGGGTDSGPGGGCPPAEAPMPTMPGACSAATLTCLMGAATAEAQQACVDMDPNAMNCDACITQDLFFTCSNNMGGGCSQEWGNIQCCLMENCPTGDQTCIQGALGMGGACGAQIQGFFTCANAAQMAMRCGITNGCFAMAGPFLPDFEQHPPMSVDWSMDEYRSFVASHFAGRW